MAFSLIRDLYDPREEERKRKQAILESQLLLMKDQANSGAYGPEQANQMTLGQGKDGLLEFPTKTPTGEAIDFKPKRQDPNTPVEVDERMGKLLGLTPGVYTWYEREQALNNKRAEAAAGAPGERQKEGFKEDQKKLPRENLLKAMDTADAAVATFIKTIPGQIASPETIKTVREKALNDALDALDTAGKPKNPGKSNPAPASKADGALPPTQGVAEGSYLKKGGVRTHILKGGQWQPL